MHLHLKRRLLIRGHTDKGGKEARTHPFLVQHSGRVKELVQVEGDPARFGFPSGRVSFGLNALIMRIRDNRIIPGTDGRHISIKDYRRQIDLFRQHLGGHGQLKEGVLMLDIFGFWNYSIR